MVVVFGSLLVSCVDTDKPPKAENIGDDRRRSRNDSRVLVLDAALNFLPLSLDLDGVTCCSVSSCTWVRVVSALFLGECTGELFRRGSVLEMRCLIFEAVLLIEIDDDEEEVLGVGDAGRTTSDGRDMCPGPVLLPVVAPCFR